MKVANAAMLFFLGASVAGAATLTVGSTGQYQTVCTAVYASHDGDTILIDANHGTPYVMPPDPNHSDGRIDCTVNQNNLTIRGVHGRAILDGSPTPFGDGLTYVQKGIFVLNGHDITIDNLELRNANNLVNPDSSRNAAGLRIQNGTNAAPNGGNITVTRCYIHDNGDGVLSGNTGPGTGQYFSPNPFITFKYDNFYHNGVAGSGQEHNMYIGYDGFGTMKFTLEYSVSKNAYVGHDVKTRAPYNYILYNQISDTVGDTSYELDFPLGGTTWVVGNLIYKTAVDENLANNNMMIYRDVHDNTASDPVYGPPNEDLHFLNNIVVDNNLSSSNAYVNVSCANADSTTCPAPNAGPVLTTPAEVKGNLFIGQPTQVTNQPDAVTKFNLIIPYSNLAALGFQPQ
jgi:hypothetical protein